MTKFHRTAVILDTRVTFAQYRERCNRLAQSVNGQNIKVDFYHLTYDDSGLRLRQGLPFQADHYDFTPCPVVNIVEAARHLTLVEGYHLVLPAVTAETGWNLEALSQVVKTMKPPSIEVEAGPGTVTVAEPEAVTWSAPEPDEDEEDESDIW